MSVYCGTCARPVPSRKGMVGAPRKTCGQERCARIANRIRKRLVCARCACPLIFARERQRVVCDHCVDEVEALEQLSRGGAP